MRIIPPVSRTVRWVASTPLVFVVIWFVMSGVSDAAPEDRASSVQLWKWQQRYVRIEPQAASNAPANNHPVDFTSQQIGIMLDALRVVLPQRKRFFSRDKPASETGEPVFADSELEVLSDSLSRGLARAGPREDIVFVTTGNYDRAFGGVLKEREVNTGRVFYVDGKLNIIFGEIRGQFSEPRGAGAMVAYPAVNPVPGSRNASVPHEWNIVPEPGVSLYEHNRVSRSDWVLIDPDTSVARYEEKQKLEALSGEEGLSPLAEETERLAAEQEELRQKVRQLEQDAQSGKTPVAATRPPETPPPEAEKTAMPKATVIAPATSNGSLEQRLTVLKRLLDQDLISEDIYNAKVKELLNENL